MATTCPRPITGAGLAEIGFFDNGANCGRYVHVTIGDFCTGINNGAADYPFCQGADGWVTDQFTGAELDMVVADSCQDGNAWCRDDAYHLDLAQPSLNLFELNGVPVGDMFPNFWQNRQIHWYFEEAPLYTGDINIGFITSASVTWGAISITHLQNGIHGVNYYSNGAWVAAVMDGDLGEDYIISPHGDRRIAVRDPGAGYYKPANQQRAHLLVLVPGKLPRGCLLAAIHAGNLHHFTTCHHYNRCCCYYQVGGCSLPSPESEPICSDSGLNSGDNSLAAIFALPPGMVSLKERIPAAS